MNHVCFQRHLVTGSQLEMEMIGGGGSAPGTIVENGVFRVGTGNIQHITQVSGYELGDMFVQCSLGKLTIDIISLGHSLSVLIVRTLLIIIKFKQHDPTVLIKTKLMG